jgi:hypothetical protein
VWSRTSERTLGAAVYLRPMRRRRVGRRFLGSSMARSAMAGLFREVVDAFSANRRAVLARRSWPPSAQRLRPPASNSRMAKNCACS